MDNEKILKIDSIKFKTKGENIMINEVVEKLKNLDVETPTIDVLLKPYVKGNIRNEGTGPGAGSWLSKVVKESKAKNAIEIGSRTGMSTAFIRDGLIHNDGKSIISIDLNVGRSDKVFDFNIKYYKPIEIIKYWNKTSESVFDDVKNYLLKNNMKVDFLLIDGDHSYESTKKDYELYSTLVEKNGFIVFDDYGTGQIGVKRFIDETFDKKDFIIDPFRGMCLVLAK